MNKIYRSVWSKGLGCWIAAPECARGKGKQGAVVDASAGERGADRSDGKPKHRAAGVRQGIALTAAMLLGMGQTSMAQVPADPSLVLDYWDGAGPLNNGQVNGGTGTWQGPAGNLNWTNAMGVPNTAYSDGSFAIFSGSPGTVTVDNSLGPVTFGGMQFAADGYTVQGAAISLAGSNVQIHVGDALAGLPGSLDSPGSASYKATIASVLQGAGSLTKTGAGTLVLGGANTYTGGTSIHGGVLSISSDQNLGDETGDLNFDGGTLQATANLTSYRPIILTGNGGTFNTQGNTVTHASSITGAAGFHKTGSGTLILQGTPAVFGGIKYTGKTIIDEGTLEFQSNLSPTRKIQSEIINNGILILDSIYGDWDEIISGSGSVEITDTKIIGTYIVFNRNNTYTGKTTIGPGATLSLGSLLSTTTEGSVGGDILNNGYLSIERTTALELNHVISGSGKISLWGGGTGLITMTGQDTFSGELSAGKITLIINGDQSGAKGPLFVSADSTLGGTGIIGGNVNLSGVSTLSPGAIAGQPGTLTINGNLSLNSNAKLAYDFGQAGTVGGPLNDLTVVKGNLTLAGTINVNQSAGGNFEPGLYRVISYDGALTNKGLKLGALPTGSTAAVQTSVAHQVNLINTTGLTFNYWDGAAGPKENNQINGDNGSWQVSAGNNNWTDMYGAINAGYTNGSFAIFSATPGTVTVNNSLGQVVSGGMQFASDGYVVTGQPIDLAGSDVTIRVGDGTTAGSAYQARIDSDLQGAAALTKADLGTLVLNGINTYAGGTHIHGGVLSVSSDQNLGNATGALGLDGGTLQTTANLTSHRAVTLGAGGGTFDTLGNVVKLTNTVAGAGDLCKTGSGTLVLAGDGSVPSSGIGYTGKTTIDAGVLQLGDGAVGSILLAGDVLNKGTLVADSAQVNLDGVISGTGAFKVTGAAGNTAVFSQDNSYTGGTTIDAGTSLKLGEPLGAGLSGSLVGKVLNNGTLALHRNNTLALDGIISGIGQLTQEGTGTTILTGRNTYSGVTDLFHGTLLVNGDQGGATGLTTAYAGSTLGGGGVIGGDVLVSDGATLSPGGILAQPGTLAIKGNLGLSGLSKLNYDFGQANTIGGPRNDLTEVHGNLQLGGTIDVTLSAGSTLAPGLYRVINYDGALTNNGLALGTMPPGSTMYVQTSIDKQVNLVNTAGVALRFWDGAAGIKNDGLIQGGDGNWQAFTGNDDWTDVSATPNAGYASGSFAVFSGTPGTVTVDNSLGQVVSGGMQFATNGYVIKGEPITLAGTNVTIRVGDGTIPGSAYTATIDAVLQGAAGLTKTDAGTLVLGGINTYTGNTHIHDGVLSVSSEQNLGAATNSLIFDGGTLQTTADFTNHRSVTLDAGGGTFDTQNHTVQLANSVAGTGGLRKTGSGTLVLLGDAALANAGISYTGTTDVAQGTLRAGAANTFSHASQHTVASGATLDLAGFDQTVAGLNNSGTVNLRGSTPGTTLKLTGPYVGNNGNLLVSTVLGADGSPSDRLLLSGPAAVASGNTLIQVSNAGGLGALTGAHGIGVIATENGASLQPEAFSLAGGHVDAGAYEYRLEQNAQGASLHSRLIGGGPDPVLPPEEVITYRNEVPLLSALPAQLRQSDMAMLGDLHKRMGDELGSNAAVAANDTGRRVWGRVLHTEPSIRQQGTVSPQSDSNMTGFQAGLDLYTDPRFKLGFYVGQLEGNMHVRGFASGVQNKYVGFNSVRSRYLGMYGTWQDASGLYADGVLQKTEHRSDLRSLDGASARTKGDGWTASLEVGKTVELGSRWQMEPQAQIIYRSLSLDDTQLRLAQVKNHVDDDWTLRLGVRVKGSFATSAGMLQPYGRLNLYHSSGGTNVATFGAPGGSSDIVAKGSYLSTEIAAGATLHLSKNTSFYGELGAQQAHGGGARVSSGIQASMGVKVRW